MLIKNLTVFRTFFWLTQKKKNKIPNFRELNFKWHHPDIRPKKNLGLDPDPNPKPNETQIQILSSKNLMGLKNIRKIKKTF